MRDKILNILLGSAVLAVIVVLISRLETSAIFATLIVFVLLAVVAFGFVAVTGDDFVEEPDEDKTKQLPLGFGRALLEQMPLALVLINERGRITYANSAAQKLVPRLTTGDHFANLFRVPAFVETVNSTLDDGGAREQVFSLPGQERVFEAEIGPLPQGGDFGTDRQVIVKIEDRTQERRAEQMRTDFIANASHELRTPLASVMGYVETLQGHAKDDPQAQERFLDIMSKQAARMHRLVEDLMSLSRIELDAHVTPDDPCDLHSIVHEVGTALKPLADKHEVTLDIRLGEGVKTVKGDQHQLHQVATNLIDNAIKYGAGGTVTVSQAKPNEKYPRMIGISVQDEGGGISSEHLHRLTERFYRVNVAQSRKVGGTGLGLAIVKHILNRHGGELQIESKDGNGSRFTFWVPAFNKAVTLAEAKSEELESNN